MERIHYQEVTTYQPNQPKKPDEAFDQYIARVRTEAQTRQKVSVGESSVVFGVEGPILIGHAQMTLVTAEVENGEWGTHYVLFSSDLITLREKQDRTHVRLESGCASGIIFGDETCDCKQQLRQAQEKVLEAGGVIIYTPDQDGRGWGELKMATQRIMHETQVDTITAATSFYADDDDIDVRSFDEQALILRALGFPTGYSFLINTTKEQKTEPLKTAGYHVLLEDEKINRSELNDVQKKNREAKERYRSL